MDENQSTLVPYTCPACKGVLRKEAENSFQCPVGHVYTRQTLITKQSELVEAGLWATIRILEEQDKVLTELLNNEHSADEPGVSYSLENSAALS